MGNESIMSEYGQSLEKVIATADDLKQVKKSDVYFGDLIIVNTRNSVYSLKAVERDLFLVSGGWFDRKGMSPLKTTVRGCTWGGSIIKVDIIAACGLCLEFGNRVVTTAIEKVSVVRLNDVILQ
jgi:hypothetical protein